MDKSILPVVVIGAGPVGLAAAAHLVKRGETPLVLEAGSTVGASIRQWGHVRVFSPWKYNIDPVSASLLKETGWQEPAGDYLPTGAEFVEQYLEPLAATPSLKAHIHLNSKVLAVTRLGFDKLKSVGRENAPFLVMVEQRPVDGQREEIEILAKAVIDASGTYTQPNVLGASGVPARGEKALSQSGRIFYGIPDVLGRERARYAGNRVLVVGSGHSAFNALLDLVELSKEEPGTRITWVIRRKYLDNLYGGESNDALPARGSLGYRLHQAVEEGKIKLVSGFKIANLEQTGVGITVTGEHRKLPPVDQIIATTGFRPDLSMTGELRLNLDPSLESPAALAPLIDPNVHSCGSVPPHGEAELAHPQEPGFYTVGMKSYGRAPTFLMLTGYEQVRSIVSALVGDWKAAREVELVLPQTGVCSVNNRNLTDDGGASCCGIAPTKSALKVEPLPVPVLVKAGNSSSGSCCG
ncbi:MAG: FAD-dependent oxidoreductase [Chloroflexi bacterium]|nr:FAD-dependent oxidoreductase [Chloroflexota bacterium]OJV99090.1 MAG: flavoprotein [Chloroflexi bacterium 54-19]